MKKTKLIRVISCLLIAMLIFTGNTSVLAGEVSGDTVTIVMSETLGDIELTPGTTTHVKLPVKVATSDRMLTNVSANVAVTDGKGGNVASIKAKNIKLTRPNALDSQNYITFYDSTYVEFDLVTKETAKIGQYSIVISFTSMTDQFSANSLSLPCYINNELQPAELSVTSFNYDKDSAVIGNSLKLNMNVKNEGQTEALSGYVSIDYGETGLKADYTTTKVKLGDFAAGTSTSVSLPVQILKTATKGTKTLKVTFSYKDADGTEYSSSTEVYVDVISNEAAPELSFSDISYKGSLLVGTDFKVIATLKNIGSSKANNVKIAVTDGVAADAIMPDFSTSAISADSIKAGDNTKVTIPLKISKDATKGTKAITLVATYEDATGVEYTQKTVIYPVVKANEEIKKEEGTPNIIISNVTQSPSVPNAGGQVTLSFDIENKGGINVTDFKLGATGLTADTFSPVSSDPYIYFDKLEAGKSKHLSMTFELSKNIPEGFGSIPISYSYKYGETGTEETKTASLNVLDIVNDLDDLSKSVPKLIISHFGTDIEDLRAGQTFTFTYDIKNTHNSVAAKNIKVTISQADNIFTVTSGSNSSYIDVIEPGTTKTNTIELKVKSDATTKAYPLTITMAYEYDGAEVSPVTGKVGEEVTETINLQAVENSRPEVENMYLDNWSTPTVGQSALLNFQFYNMGKSTLSNVYATISGDFQKTDGDKQIIGNVNAGESQYVEMDVTPLVEGDCTGIVTITFEDSNGDELTMTQEFTAFVMGATSMDAYPDGSYIDTMAPVAVAKKPLLPVWAFIAVQVGILVVVTMVTRGIIIKCYKKKLEKAGEEI